MVKIIFSDFDETLINYYGDKNELSEYARDVLDRVKENGIKFVIVTGRPISFFDRIDGLLNYVDYIISSNGAEIYDMKSNEVIFNKGISKDIFYNVLVYCKENNINFLINSGINRYSYGDVKASNCISIDNISNSESINQIIFLPDNSKEFNELKYFLVGVKNIRLNNIVYNDERCSIDINAEDVSKGNSIEYLCNLLNIDKYDTIGFGDSNNDISMFDVVGKSICVGNASDVIKQLVDEVIDNCDNEGVFKYLNDNILK